MTKKSRSSLIIQANTDLPDNNAMLISPADVRGMFKDVIDSFVSNSGETSISGVLRYLNTVTISDNYDLITKLYADTNYAPVSVANAFIQGGNSFTATAVIGTNDAFDLQFRTQGVERGAIGSTGKWMMGVTTPHTNTYFSVQSQGTGSGTNAYLIKNSTPFDISWLKDNGEFTVRSTMANSTPVVTILDNVDTTLFQILANASIISPGSFLAADLSASFNAYARSAFGPLGNATIQYGNYLLRDDQPTIAGDRLNWKFGYLLDGGTINLDWLLKTFTGSWSATTALTAPTFYGSAAASGNMQLYSTSDATKGFIYIGGSSAYNDLLSRLGVGTQAPSAKIHAVSTSEQLRLGYDTTNYFTTTVGSTGSVTFDLTGTGPGFTFNKFVVFAGLITTSGSISAANFASGTTSVQTSALTNAELLFGGAAAVRARVTSRGSTQSTLSANESYASWIFGTQGFTEAASGTHALAAQVVFKAISITAGAATTTDSATVYIEGAATGATNNYAFWVDAGVSRFDGNLSITDVDFVLGTTTGTKIGTSTSQKIGLWNATPIVQPTTAVTAATFVANTSGIVDDTATFDGYTIGQVVKALRNIGILA
jgi:hypothetical protein